MVDLNKPLNFQLRTMRFAHMRFIKIYNTLKTLKTLIYNCTYIFVHVYKKFFNNAQKIFFKKNDPLVLKSTREARMYVNKPF